MGIRFLGRKKDIERFFCQGYGKKSWGLNETAQKGHLISFIKASKSIVFFLIKQYFILYRSLKVYLLNTLNF